MKCSSLIHHLAQMQCSTSPKLNECTTYAVQPRLNIQTSEEQLHLARHPTSEEQLFLRGELSPSPPMTERPSTDRPRTAGDHTNSSRTKMASSCTKATDAPDGLNQSISKPNQSTCSSNPTHAQGNQSSAIIA